MKISENRLVTLEYRLKVKNDDGELELMEETTQEEPLRYYHGLGMMLPKFEEQLDGLAAGDEFEFMLPCADAYGEYDDENVVNLPRNIFEIDGKFDPEKVHEGAIVPLVDSEGNRINAEVVEVKDNSVKVDFNHPLAGEDLYFSGKIISVEELSDEELQRLMHHGGCGCGCSCGDGDCGSGCGDGGCSGGCHGGCC